MRKRLILAVAAALALACLGRTLAATTQAAFFVDPDGGAVLVVRADRPARIALYDPDGVPIAVYETARLVLALEGGERCRVVVRGARAVFHALYPKEKPRMFNKKTLNEAGGHGIIDELNSGGPLPQVGYERPCEEGEQSHE